MNIITITKYLLLLSSISVAATTANAVNIPLLQHGSTLYLSADFHYEHASHIKVNQFKSYEKALLAFKQATQNPAALFSSTDGSQKLYKDSLSTGIDYSQLYKGVLGMRFAGKIRWGDYESAVMEYNFPKYGFKHWREDFVCTSSSCLVSISLSNTLKNQPFEIAYKAFVERLVKQNETPGKANSKGYAVALFPEWSNKNSNNQNYPLTISIFHEKYDMNLCVNCGNKKSALLKKDTLGLEKSFKQFVDVNRNSSLEVENFIKSYNAGFSINNTVVPIIRWHEGRPTKTYVPYETFSKRLLDAKSIQSQGYVRDSQYMFLFTKNIDRKEEELSTNNDIYIWVLKNTANKGWLPWFGKTGTHIENLIFDERVISAIIKSLAGKSP